jgi:hypothetical protein
MKFPKPGYERLHVASITTMTITGLLFVVGAFLHGLSHDLLLEAGVFLVSVKLVLATRNNELLSRAIQAKLDRLDSKLDKTLAEKRKSA